MKLATFVFLSISVYRLSQAVPLLPSSVRASYTFTFNHATTQSQASPFRIGVELQNYTGVGLSDINADLARRDNVVNTPEDLVNPESPVTPDITQTGESPNSGWGGIAQAPLSIMQQGSGPGPNAQQPIQQASAPDAHATQAAGISPHAPCAEKHRRSESDYVIPDGFYLVKRDYMDELWSRMLQSRSGSSKRATKPHSLSPKQNGSSKKLPSEHNSKSSTTKSSTSPKPSSKGQSSAHPSTSAISSTTHSGSSTAVTAASSTASTSSAGHQASGLTSSSTKTSTGSLATGSASPSSSKECHMSSQRFKWSLPWGSSSSTSPEGSASNKKLVKSKGKNSSLMVAQHDATRKAKSKTKPAKGKRGGLGAPSISNSTTGSITVNGKQYQLDKQVTHGKAPVFISGGTDQHPKYYIKQSMSDTSNVTSSDQSKSGVPLSRTKQALNILGASSVWYDSGKDTAGKNWVILNAPQHAMTLADRWMDLTHKAVAAKQKPPKESQCLSEAKQAKTMLVDAHKKTMGELGVVSNKTGMRDVLFSNGKSIGPMYLLDFGSVLTKAGCFFK
ncbi:hypothetical protein NP233_g463 [Leucocoprinus birnbaumii]|uniref:Uncharacterized protein n=1 Tax=Leucocoprinus birnbaumii TaxID=56174 RepID=A0AAD5Z0A4_9AGAR|nr:hypothetical protein NP233_g463 [Leucocoprinus birnbaumii]